MATIHSGPDGILNIDVIKRISKEEYDILDNDIKVIQQFQYAQELMGIFVSIVEDIENAIPTRSLTKVKRLFTEAGSTFYLILQMLKMQTSKRFGSKSNERKLLDSRIKEERDSCFEYRLMYELRNLMVHCEFPPMEIDSNIELSELIVRGEDLLSLSYKWEDVREDIADHKKIDLLLVCKTVQRCLSDLTVFYLNLLNVTDIYYSSSRLSSYSQYRKNENDDIVVFRYDDEQKIKSGNFQFKDLTLLPIKGASVIFSAISVS